MHIIVFVLEMEMEILLINLNYENVIDIQVRFFS
jgi:hypothetical protein